MYIEGQIGISTGKYNWCGKEGYKANGCNDKTKSFKERGWGRQAPSAAQAEGQQAPPDQARPEPLKAHNWMINLRKPPDAEPSGGHAKIATSLRETTNISEYVVVKTKQGPKVKKEQKNQRRHAWFAASKNSSQALQTEEGKMSQPRMGPNVTHVIVENGVNLALVPNITQQLARGRLRRK